ncbi:O-antigen ligase family protein [Sphingomonas sp. ZB1N12]
MLIVRPLAVLYITVILALPRIRYWQGLVWPMALLGAFGAVIAIQLIPLPPSAWSVLPGHARFTEAALALGRPQPWRPISVSPDMTLNALLALLIPLAVLVGAAGIEPRQRTRLIPVLLIAMIVSALFGIAQMAGSASSPLYLYRYTNRDLPVGLFANRNHQAVFLAMAFPLLRAWTVLPSKIFADPRLRGWLAGACALLILPVVLASGSRSGLVLTLVAVCATSVIAPWDLGSILSPVDKRSKHADAQRTIRRRRLLVAVVITTVVLVTASVVFFGRALSITRIGQLDQAEADLRIRFLPIVWSITRDFFPFGTGFGTFDPMFRLYEPFWALKPTFFNRAHNDFLELLMTGGLPALLVLIILIGFIVSRLRDVVGAGWRHRSTVTTKVGIALVMLAFAASLTDYPLRTPGMSMVFALAMVWLASPIEGKKDRTLRS